MIFKPKNTFYYLQNELKTDPPKYLAKENPIRLTISKLEIAESVN